MSKTATSSNSDNRNADDDHDGDRKKASLDTAIFIPALVIALAVIIFLLADRELAAELSAKAMASVTGNWGWLFDIFCFSAFVFSMWLAFGRFGHVKLGQGDGPPEYSELNWAAMMFSAGIGIGLVTWSFVEPVYYLATPPLGIEAHSSSAAEWAHMYALFHWSIVPWSVYAVPSVAVAYVLYVRKTPLLRISETCRPLLKHHTDGWIGSLIDTLVILGLIGGAGTSLGLGVPLVSAFVANLLGYEDSLLTQLGVLLTWTVIFGFSVYRGLNAGIRILSDINIFLAIAIVLFVLLAGPTVFILSISANSFGLMVDNFMRMSFWLDPIDKGGFPDAWTLFYWAWWIAYAPMMGLFFGRISQGRTVRQLVLGVLCWGSLGCVSFIAVCGGYAIEMQYSGAMDVSAKLAAEGIAPTVVALVNSLPFSTALSILFTLLSFVFLATTLDSAAYVLASISTKNLRGSEEPARYNRLVWAAVLAMVAVGLLYVDGLKIVQSSTIVTALPLIPVLVLVMLALRRALNDDFGARLNTKPVLIEDSSTTAN
ncbi:MAG: BCCT family betaine/carnitine transporter [Paraglaciecola psychrophila]